MGALGEPEGDLSEENRVSGGFPVTQLWLFSPLVISAEIPGWWLRYGHESTSAGATTGQLSLAEGQDR